MIEFEPISAENSKYINILKGKNDQLALVHYNAHWFGQSQICDDVLFFLIRKENEYVGVICIGQHYADEYLQERVKDTAEIIHIVIDRNHQGKGLGKQAIKNAIVKLDSIGYSSIIAAIFEDNKLSEKLFLSCGFNQTSNRNYDGDIIFKYQ